MSAYARTSYGHDKSIVFLFVDLAYYFVDGVQVQPKGQYIIII